MSVNQIERAARAWPILVSYARNWDKLTYGDLGRALGIHHRAVRYVLSVLQDYCLEEKLPPITILVVNASGRPGPGFIAYDINNFNEGFEQVCSFGWSSLENPFAFAETGESYGSLIDKLSNSPESSEEVYKLVKSRGIKQILFREVLLKTYTSRCAFTKISFVESLEACHIVPWAQSSPAERLDVRNGLLLNSFHHKLFDRGFITLSPNYRIIYYDPQELDGNYMEFDRLLTIGLHGKEMHMPRLTKHRPSVEYINRHNKIMECESYEIEN